MGGRLPLDIELNLYWDSCVFIRYLTGSITDACFEDICQFVDEARRGLGVRIYTSTVALAEIRPRHLRQGQLGSVNDMIEDFRAQSH
jgi:hypothetical protein